MAEQNKSGEFVKELKKQDKVKIRIPLRDDDEEGAFEVVAINGHIYQIKKGEDVEVPVVVKARLVKAGRI
jgi:hypothetical protein